LATCPWLAGLLELYEVHRTFISAGTDRVLAASAAVAADLPQPPPQHHPFFPQFPNFFGPPPAEPVEIPAQHQHVRDFVSHCVRLERFEFPSSVPSCATNYMRGLVSSRLFELPSLLLWLWGIRVRVRLFD
jgi:hypothetical protein